MIKHDKLWVDILTYKYIPHSSLSQARVRSGDSFTWKSILQAYSWLQDGFRFCVGTGHVSFWYDKWLDIGKLCDQVFFVNIQDVNMRVANVFYDRKWHLEKLATWLPEDVISHICASPITEDVLIDDSIIWPFSATGAFTSKSAYGCCYPNFMDLQIMSFLGGCGKLRHLRRYVS